VVRLTLTAIFVIALRENPSCYEARGNVKGRCFSRRNCVGNAKRLKQDSKRSGAAGSKALPIVSSNSLKKEQ